MATKPTATKTVEQMRLEVKRSLDEVQDALAALRSAAGIPPRSEGGSIGEQFARSPAVVAFLRKEISSARKSASGDHFDYETKLLRYDD